jgi:hypothetical protein
MSNGSDQAFPVPGITGLPNDNFLEPTVGLTKRELFAAMAMQGLMRMVAPTRIPHRGNEKYIASAAVACADALLAELGKQPAGGGE